MGDRHEEYNDRDDIQQKDALDDMSVGRLLSTNGLRPNDCCAPEMRHHSVAAWLHKCNATGLADEPVTNACSAVLPYMESDGDKLQQKRVKDFAIS